MAFEGGGEHEHHFSFRMWVTLLQQWNLDVIRPNTYSVEDVEGPFFESEKQPILNSLRQNDRTNIMFLDNYIVND